MMTGNAVLIAALTWVPPAAAYQWPVLPVSGGFSDPSEVNAVIGEYRDTPLAQGGPSIPHFHDGVDIGRSAGMNVYASVPGMVMIAAGEQVRIRATAGTFSYIHIVPDNQLMNDLNASPGGVPVDAGGQVLGKIDSRNHLHFREWDISEISVQNNLRTGGLDRYSDSVPPTVSNVVLFDAQNLGSGPLTGTIPGRTTQITIRARARDAQSTGSDNTGIYQIGYRVFSANGSQPIPDNFPKQTFDSFPRIFFSNPGKAYDTTISRGFLNGVLDAYYFASNDFNPNTPATPLVASSLPDGQYNVCVLAKDIKGNGGNIGSLPPQGAACTGILIDRTPPLITVTDVNSQVLSSHSVTSAVGIHIAGNDTFGSVPGSGISNVSLTCEAFADSIKYSTFPTGAFLQSASEYFPADLTVLPQGACIAKVTDGAGNTSTLEFFIQREPIALFNENNRSQPLQSELPLSAETSWSRANTLKFHLAHDDGIRRFTLFRGVGTVQEIVLNEVPEDPAPATIFFVALSSSAAGNKIPDSRETYTARLEPVVGEAIERYFVLDRNPPKVDLEEATASPAGSVVITGAVHDEASGISTVVAIPEAAVGPGSGPPDYDGPTYPPGDASQSVGGTFGPGRYFHVARDRSGLAPAVGGSLLGFHVTEEAGYPPAGGGSIFCNRPQPVEYQPFFFGNAGYELKQATMTAGFRFSSPVRQQQYDEGRLTLTENPPNFGEVRLLMRSNDTTRVPFPDLWTVRSFNAPTAEAPVMMITKPGLKTIPLSVPLAPDVVARIEVPEDIKSPPTTALLKTCDAQGVCTTNPIALGEGEIVPTDIGAECKFLTATVEGVDEDVSDTVPAVPTLNARFDLKGVFVEADEITTQGSLTVGRVPFAPPAGLHLEGFVWNINLTAGFQPPLRIGISNQRVWPDYILSKAKCYRVVEGTLAELTCVVGADEAVAQSPGTSLFFTAVKDGLAPRSSASYAGGSFELPGGSLVVSTRTRVTLSAADPAEDGHVDSGVTATYLKRDGVFVSTSDPGVELFNGQPFTLTEGAAEFSFASEDFFKNVELPTTTRVAVDGTPPSASYSLTGPAVLEPSRLIVGPQTFLSFTSLDPVSNGVSAGTAAVAVLLDQTPQSCGLSLEEPPAVDPAAPPGSCANPLYGTPFAVPAGTHSLTYFGSADPRFSDENALPADCA